MPLPTAIEQSWHSIIIGIMGLYYLFSLVVYGEM